MKKCTFWQITVAAIKAGAIVGLVAGGVVAYRSGGDIRIGRLFGQGWEERQISLAFGPVRLSFSFGEEAISLQDETPVPLATQVAGWRRWSQRLWDGAFRLVAQRSIAARPSSARSVPQHEPHPALQPHLDPLTGYYDPLGPAEFTLEELVNIAVYENVNKAVVNINTKGLSGGRFLIWEIPTEGEGSGVVLDKRGHILTNYHVVERAETIEVTLFDGTSYQAQLVGGDPATDIAVLRISAPPDKLFPVIFGDSSRLRVGQRVYAIGNPFGLERTMTTGIISSLNRELPSQRRYRKITQVIQIDAAINPGNSGGPLLDTHSRMIGMNTAIASRTGESAGVGFAIPVNTVAKVVPQLIERGRVIRPDIGISRVYQTEAGLLIAGLVPGGAAARAGLRGPQVIRRERRQGLLVYEYTVIDRKAADLIIGVNGKPTPTVEEFLNVIESFNPGDKVTINIIRDGKEMSVPVILDAEK